MDLPSFEQVYDEQMPILKILSEKMKSNVPYYRGFKNFSQKYMLPYHIWNDIFVLADECAIIDKEDAYLIGLADYHMFYPKEIKSEEPQFDNKKLYFKNRRNSIHEFYIKNAENIGRLNCDMDMLVQDLQYPHCGLEKIWAIYEMYLGSFPSKEVVEKYEKMKQLYARILNADERDDTVEWLKALMETGHHEFICTNIEYKIGSDLSNQFLWKSYCHYLQSYDINKMLQTYSKFCRFFTNDFETRKEYENSVKEYGNGALEVPWQNPFSWEVYDPKFFEKQMALTGTDAPKMQNDLIQCYFSSENAKSQILPFKSSLLQYIQQNASAEVLHKLQKTCKLFALKNPYLICYNFTFSSRQPDFNGIKFHEQSMEVVGCDLSRIGKIFVSTVLRINGIEKMSEFFSKIICCTAKYISFSYLKLKPAEMELLIKDANVIYFHLNGVEVIDSANGVQMNLEDILRMVPKVKDLSIKGFATTPETLKNMLKVSFDNKLDEFGIDFSDITHCNNELFGEFIKKNCSSKCKILHFFTNEEYLMNKDAIDESSDFIKNLIETHWNNERQKPSFSHMFTFIYYFPE